MNLKGQLHRFWLAPSSGNAVFPSIILLLFRLGYGWDLIVTAWSGHLPNAADMITRFAKWGVPFPTPSFYISAYTELVCGGLLMLGLATRFISIPLAINFIVAYLTASRDEIVHFFSQNPSAVIEDSAFPFLLVALLMLAFGPGLISFDYLIGWIMGKRVRG